MEVHRKSELNEADSRCIMPSVQWMLVATMLILVNILAVLSESKGLIFTVALMVGMFGVAYAFYDRFMAPSMH